MKPCTSVLAAAAAIALLLPASAAADHHLIKISEVYPSASGIEEDQYVELQMYAPGQNDLGGHSVVIYNRQGATLTTATFPGPVPHGLDQRKILVGGPAVESTFGVAPDLLTPGPMPGIDPEGGAVCFNSASLGSIDCVAWGDFVGPVPGPTGTNALKVLNDQSLERTIAPNDPLLLEAADDTDDSLTDFSAATPSPENNAMPADAVEVLGATLEARGKQKRRRGKVKTRVGADEAVTVELKAKGKARGRIPARGVKFKTRKVEVAAGERRTVTLKAKNKKARRILKRYRKTKLKVTATFTDTTGSTDRKTVKVLLK